MSNEKTKKVGKLKLTEFEISQAYTHLYEEFGPIVQIWTQDKLDDMICEFWLHNGKTEENE